MSWNALIPISSKFDESNPHGIDWWIGHVLLHVSSGWKITRQLLGVQFHDLHHDVDQAVAVKWCLHCAEFPIIIPGRILKSICSFASTFRNIFQRQWNPDVYKETYNNLEAVVAVAPFWLRNPLQRTSWHLQDLKDGGSLGFTVELFFLSLKQHLSTYSPETSESHSTLCIIGTFRAITSDWSKYWYSLGTQRVLLDMIASDNGIRVVSKFGYPTYILHEFLVTTWQRFCRTDRPAYRRRTAAACKNVQPEISRITIL